MAFDGRKLFEFGPYRLDKLKRQLWCDGQVVPLTAKAMDILVLLIGREGDVVSRRELIDAVWPDAYVEEANLTQNVFMLRKALGESAHNHNYIVTIPGKGYRFACEVREITPGNGGTGSAATVGATPSLFSVAADIQPGPEIAGSSSAVGSPLVAGEAPIGLSPTEAVGSPPGLRRRWLWISAAALLVFALAGYLALREVRHRNGPAARRIVIAVLPFANLTGDPAQDYFSDGLTEEMIMQVGRVDPQHMGVIGRSSIMRYRGPEQLEKIRQELGVDYVLEGSVRRDSNKVRIAAQLVEMKQQTRVWAEEYDRELTSLLVLQNTIAQEIADQIERTLGNHRRPGGQPQPPLSPSAYQAYDLYLQGRYFWNKRTPRGLEQALECFQRAIIKEPAYARAYAGLADSYVLMSAYSLVPAGDFMPKARAAAQHALALDDSLAEAHASLALIAQNYDWDWPAAEKEFRRAIQLDPNYATAHHWYAEHLALQGRFDEAFPEIERARQLDPLSLIIATDHGAMLYFSRQYDRAIQQFRTVLQMEPNFGRAHMLVYVYVEKRQFADAVADVENWRRVSDTPWRWSLLTYVYGRSGDQAKARHALGRLQHLYSQRQLDAAPMFIAHIGLGNKDEALAWLQKAYLQHSAALTALKVDPTYDPLRNDPRFQDLLRRLGLAQ